MAKIKGMRSLLRKLEKLERAANRKHTGDVVVGYEANYALHVHENMEMKLKGQKRGGKKSKKSKGRYWDPQGKAQAKFLEQPAREMQDEMAAIVVQATKGGATLQQALILAGLRLQAVSQKLVPVDTGNLKASAFTEKE